MQKIPIKTRIVTASKLLIIINDLIESGDEHTAVRLLSELATYLVITDTKCVAKGV